VSEITISPVSTRDVRQILAIEAVSFPEPWSETLLKGEIAMRDTRRYSKAQQSKKIVGYLGLMFIDDEAHINTIATLPAARGQGIASMLLLDGIDAAIERGARQLTLEVATSNLAAQSLYRRFGLAPVGVRKGYYKGGEDALVMWCRGIEQNDEVSRRAEIAATLGLDR